MLVGVMMLAWGMAADPASAATAVLQRADAAIAAKRPQQALALIAPVLETLTAEAERSGKLTYCAMNPAQTLAYMASATAAKRAAVAIRPDLCTALYLRGFALFELGRVDEAQAAYRKAVELAPMHAHFQAELAMTYRVQRRWREMAAACERALEAAPLADGERVNAERGGALRCLGYVRIEEGMLDEAERLYRQSLESDPTSTIAKRELQYIAEQRGKRT